MKNYLSNLLNNWEAFVLIIGGLGLMLMAFSGCGTEAGGTTAVANACSQWVQIEEGVNCPKWTQTCLYGDFKCLSVWSCGQIILQSCK